MTQKSLEPCKFVLDIGSSSHSRLIIAPGQEANRYNLGMSFLSSIKQWYVKILLMSTHNVHIQEIFLKYP